MSLAILFHFLCSQYVSDIMWVESVLQGEACNMDTQPHQISNTQQT